MTESYQLFQYDSCPFCYRVRQYLNGAKLSIPLRDILRDASARNELMTGGGRTTVPCLRIERDGKVEWLYESRDIIDYLETHSAVS